MTKTAPDYRCGYNLYDLLCIEVSGTYRTALGSAYTGLSPPAVLADHPLCLRRLMAPVGPLHARAVAGQAYHYPDMRVIAQARHGLLRTDDGSPIPSLLKAGSRPIHPARLSLSGAHIKRIR